jgi:hypothetical protein
MGNVKKNSVLETTKLITPKLYINDIRNQYIDNCYQVIDTSSLKHLVNFRIIKSIAVSLIERAVILVVMCFETF